MKLVRFEAEGRTGYGMLRGEEIAELDGTFAALNKPPVRMHALPGVKLLAPCRPGKIVAVGLNYRDHAAELGLPVPEEPVLFLKPPTAVIGPGEPVVCPAMSSRVDYEAELGVIIGKRARKLRPDEATDYILGYTCANDVTARDLQKRDGQWTRAKAFDTFCPVGPWIETGLAHGDVLIEAYLNGERKQSSRTSQFIFGIDRLISFISHVMTLEPEDLIITGTPSGIGPLKPGDLIEVRIEGIGSLINPVIR